MKNNPSESLKARILAYLESNCIGRKRAITASQLIFQLRINDTRILRQAIHQLREEGNAILSVSTYPAGYFVPADLSEVEEGLREFTSRTIKLKMAAKGIQTGLKKRFPGNQIKMDLGA